MRPTTASFSSTDVDSRFLVIYEEMKHGPLAEDADHGCKDIKETLRRTLVLDGDIEPN